MNEEQQAKNRPLFRVSFARRIGTDHKGQDILGKWREIGAIWPNKNGKPGGNLDFDHIPVELTTHGGRLYVSPVEDEADASGGAR